MTPAYRYYATVVDVIDADTLRIRVDLGFRCAVTIDGRLRGVNAPELSTPEGQAARAWLLDQFAATNRLLIESHRDRRSFARWIIDAWTMDGRSIAGMLLDAGHAKPA